MTGDGHHQFGGWVSPVWTYLTQHEGPERGIAPPVYPERDELVRLAMCDSCRCVYVVPVGEAP